MKKLLTCGLIALSAGAAGLLSRLDSARAFFANQGMFLAQGVAPGAPPTATLVASSNSVPPSTAVTLTWTSNQPSCTASQSTGSDFSTGGLANGNDSVTPTAPSTSYTVTCGAASPASTVVTVTGGGGTTVCDFGLVAYPSGSPPTPAAKAGFTHCVMYADFTASAYSNTANFMRNCGYNPPAWPAGAGFVNNYFLNGSNIANCNRSTITSDPADPSGVPQVLKLHYINNTTGAGDFFVGGAGASGGRWLEFNWPVGYGTIPGRVLPFGMYVEMVFRTPASSLNQASTAIESFDFWNNPMNTPQSAGSVLEADFIETFANGSSNSVTGGAAVIGQPSSGNACVFGGCDGNEWFEDFTTYRKLAGLITTDGNTALGVCWYVDNLSTPVGCRTASSDSAHLNYPANTVSIDFGGEFGNPGCGLDNGGSSPCVIHDVDIYIKSMSVWECSGYQNASCNGPVVSGP